MCEKKDAANDSGSIADGIIGLLLEEGVLEKVLKGETDERIVSETDMRGPSSVFEIPLPVPGKRSSLLIGIDYQLGQVSDDYLMKKSSMLVSKMLCDQRRGKSRGIKDDVRLYLILLVMDPEPGKENTVIKQKFVLEKVFGGPEVEPPGPVDLIFLNLGEYKDGLPDSLAVCDILFSRMGKDERRKLLKEKLDIEIDEKELDILDEMVGPRKKK